MARKRKKTSRKKARRRQPRPRGHWGYYLFEDLGVSVALVGKLNADESVDVGLFGVDTWRDGLIQCYGRHYETKEAFEQAMQGRSKGFKPTTVDRCRQEVAYGLRIRAAADADLPPEFEGWRCLVDPLEDVPLPPYLYRCPDCRGRLPEPYIQQLLDGVDGDMMFYLVCDRCRRPRRGKKSAEYVGIKHAELIGALEDMEAFSVTWDQDDEPGLMGMSPSSTYEEAVSMMISEGDMEKAACLAVECHIAYAAVPNDSIEDEHILKALQAFIHGESLPEAEEDPVAFLAEAIEEGIEMFEGVYGSIRGDGQEARFVASALQKVSASVRNHRRGAQPRSYIRFIHRFVQV